MQCDMYEKENWIDFESEISKIIQSLTVLSFDYTNTYPRLYEIGLRRSSLFRYVMSYIHGKAIAKNTIGTNNMFFGIDEYLPDDRKDKETEQLYDSQFIYFWSFFR